MDKIAINAQVVACIFSADGRMCSAKACKEAYRKVEIKAEKKMSQ
jgi:hypothetical protein